MMGPRRVHVGHVHVSTGTFTAVLCPGVPNASMSDTFTRTRDTFTVTPCPCPKGP